MLDIETIQKIAYAWGLKVEHHTYNGFSSMNEALQYYREHVLPEKPLDVVLVYSLQKYGEYRTAYRII